MGLNSVFSGISNGISDTVTKLTAKALTSVIAIDTDKETVHFYWCDETDKQMQHHGAESYRARPFDDEFFEKFDAVLKRYREKTPNAQLSKVALVLPDAVFFTDTIIVPSLNRAATKNALTLALSSLYQDHADFKINTYPVAQNKQVATFGAVGLRRDIIARLEQVCAANQISVQGITFASNATVNTAMALNSKLRSASFLLMDIKDDVTRFAFVVKGKTMGYYALPFGTSMLYKTRVAAEDLLFDHEPGELLVLNAKERAKAKQLTTSIDAAEADEAEDEDGREENPFTDEQENQNFEITGDFLPKKSARKLPKFMLRPQPQSKDEYVQENFRLFVKWTLDLLNNNEAIVSLGTIDTVYVNMPSDYTALLDAVNAEAAENKVTFLPAADAHTHEQTLANAELHGGFFINLYNRINVF